ncbi:hypothetical protein SteCoe_5045 [Stentor coeruleus]|uniref:Uncharacterized protein n=1 Tax=Stentor coeruleus TaxID=5963 RepID=A0A1R2CTE7_9CILI|nr:hypothetical protein SteCoe_5045 [Stentor coeruleus]
MKSNSYPYGMQITFRRSREEIISDAKKIKDPTLKKNEKLSAQKIVKRIYQLSCELENHPLPEEARNHADVIYENAIKLKEIMKNDIPEWRIIDKSLIS